MGFVDIKKLEILLVPLLNDLITGKRVEIN